MHTVSHWTLLIAVFLAASFAFPALAQDETPPPAEEESTPDPSEDQTVVTPDPTAVPQPTAPPPATATPRPTGPGAVLLEDNFDDPTRATLPLASTDPNNRSQGYVGGEYEITNGQTGQTVGFWVGPTVPGIYSDTSIAFDARVFGGPDTRHIVLTCRRQTTANSGVWVAVRPQEQRFLFYRGDGAPSPFVTLLDQRSTAIRQGEAMNNIELSCVGNTMTLSVNGVQVGQVQDTAYASGRHAFGVAGTGSTARFDNLVVTQR